MRRAGFSGLAAALAVAWASHQAPAEAQTLTDALIQAYQTSPLLDSARAQLRGADEEIAQVRAGRRPQVSAVASGSASARADAEPTTTDQLSAGLQADLLLFDNGQSRAALEAASARISAQRADLRNTEQLVLFNAVEAFLDVRRDLQVVALAENDVRVLEEQLRAAQQQFEVGEITRTDVSLTEARLAASRAQLAAARGQLETSRAAYREAVGSQPGVLQPPPPLPPLPASLAEASEIALRRSPDIIAAQFLERAAVFDFDRARAAGGPGLQAQGSVTYQTARGQAAALAGRQDDVVGTVGLQANVPLYSGGQRSSAVRQAQAVVEQRRWQLQQAARVTSTTVAAAWTNFEVARAQIGARQQQVEAARLAAEGVAEEARLGARSVLDVLDADQERLRAETDLVQARRDEYVAAYNLLRAMGLLTVEHLGLGIETYDPDVNFQRVQAAPTGGVQRDVVDRIRSRWE
jgi:outer membrane protein